MKKRASLVCEHLENISRSVLEEHQDTLRELVRRRQGVYALYRRGRVYYVGLAGNLRSRLGHHLKDRHKDSWDRFSVYLTIGDSHLRELESLILRIAKPIGNKQKGKFAKSLDIRRRLVMNIRARHRAELGEILGKSAVQKRVSTKRQSTARAGGVAVLAEYGIGTKELRRRYKGKLLRARVRKDGKIRFRGKIYNSPSMAGIAAIGRRCNGWTFWSYERAPGDWVRLDTLRR